MPTHPVGVAFHLAQLLQPAQLTAQGGRLRPQGRGLPTRLSGLRGQLGRVQGCRAVRSGARIALLARRGAVRTECTAAVPTRPVSTS